MGTAELDADVPEVLQRAPLTGGVAHFPAYRQRRLQAFKRLIEPHLLDVYVADPAMHPPFHLV